MGTVYAGALPFDVARVDVRSLAMPKTKIMVNLGNPDLAFRTAMTPNAGVGLARMEFVIDEHIGVHPMALVPPSEPTPRTGRALPRSPPPIPGPPSSSSAPSGRDRHHCRRVLA